MKKDQIRNPHTRADKSRYSIRYQEIRNYEMHAMVLSDGKRQFGDDFHWSYKQYSSTTFGSWTLRSSQ